MRDPRPRTPPAPRYFGSRDKAVAYGQEKAALMLKWAKARLLSPGPLSTSPGSRQQIDSYLLTEAILRQEFQRTVVGRVFADLLVSDAKLLGLPPYVQIRGPGIDGVYVDTGTPAGKIAKDIAFALTLSTASRPVD